MKILYFTKSFVPDAKEAAEIAALGAHARNARYATDFEACDKVAGAVPELFAEVPLAEVPEVQAGAVPELVKPKSKRIQSQAEG